jgi:hypothetical protein
MLRILLCAMLALSLSGICLPCVALASASTKSPCCPEKDGCQVPVSQQPLDREGCSGQRADLSAAERAETVSLARVPMQAVALPEAPVMFEPLFDRVSVPPAEYPPPETFPSISVLRI